MLDQISSSQPARRVHRPARAFFRGALAFLWCTLGVWGASAQPEPALTRAASQIIVKAKKGTAVSATSVVSTLKVVHAPHAAGRNEIVRVPPGADVDATIRSLRQSGKFEYVEQDSVVRLEATTPNDFHFPGEMWGLHNTGQYDGTPGADIKAPEGWDIRRAAPGVIIGLVDSGVRQTHEDLAANLWRNPGEIPGNGIDDDGNGVIDDVHGYNAYLDNGEPEDDLGHGTHVAGTIGAVGDNTVGVVGVAWRVQIIPTKFTGPDGTGLLSDAIACIEYARDNGARIINASWGAASFASEALRDTIVSLRAAGIIFVTVAGNDAADDDATPYYPGAFDLDNIIVVTATDRNDRLAFFSNFGAHSVDLAAPGQNIFSSWSGSDSDYQYYSGTSMAVPHVTGALALLEAQFPTDTYAQIIQRLLTNVDPLPNLAGKTSTGGRLNLFKALGGIGPAVPAVGIVAVDANASETAPDDASFLVTRSGATTASLLVNYAMSGTATNGSDYTALAGSVIVPAGAASATIAVHPIDDALVEGPETVTLTLLASAAYTIAPSGIASAVIVDNDLAPPVGWASRDIGPVAAAGSDSAAGDIVTVKGSGEDIWEFADEFHYRYQPWSGDGEIIARITSVGDTHGWAKAGVMWRETLNANSAHVFMCASAENGPALQRRITTGGSSQTTNGTGGSTFPTWVRLVRSGNNFSGYQSTNGTDWILVGTVTLPFATTVYVGLAVTSHNDGTLCTANFDHVALSGTSTPPPPPPPPTLSAPSSLTATATSPSAITLTWINNAPTATSLELERSVDGTNFTLLATLAATATSTTSSGLDASTTYSFRIHAWQGTDVSANSNIASATTAGAPPPAGTWLSRDIGAVAAPGSDNAAGGTVTVIGSGADIWDTADEFHYRYQSWTGDGEIIARVTALGNTYGWAKAGVMWRETLDANSANVLMCASAANGPAWQSRNATGASTQSTSGPGGSTLPFWVRLVRSGNTFTGYQSLNGTTWTLVGTITLPLATTLYLGLAVTAHNDGALCTATFDNVTLVSSTTPPSPPPTINAPSNLTALAASATQINLSWTDNSTNEDAFQPERSLDNITFVPLAPTAANATSFADPGRNAATTYYYRVRAAVGSTTSPYSNTISIATPASPGSPPGWEHADIGTVGVAGSDDASGVSLTVRGSGSDIWGNADAFRFLYRVLPLGDCVVEGQVSSITNTDGWAKAGVMIRESLAPNSRYVFAFLTPFNGVAAQLRTTTGGAATSVPGPWGATVPHWVRLVRTGSQIAAFGSPQGTTWTLIATYNFPATTPLCVGFAVTAHNNALLNTTVFADPFIQ